MKLLYFNQFTTMKKVNMIISIITTSNPAVIYVI